MCYNYTMKISSFFPHLTFSLLLCLAFSSCRQSLPPVTSLSDLNNESRIIGYAEGQSAEIYLPSEFPKAKILSFNDVLTGYEAVKSGKIDAYVFERVQIELAIKNGLSGVKILGNEGEKIPVSVGISPKNEIPDFEAVLNQFIEDIRSDGTLDDMYKRWVLDENENMPDIKPAENPKVKLRVGTTGDVMPYSYYKGTELTGYDIELARRFAASIDAELEFKVYDYGSIIAAALSGDIDCIMSNLNETPERKEEIKFSSPLYFIENAIIIKDDAKLPSSNKTDSADLKDIPPQFKNVTLKYNSKEEMQKNDRLVLGMHTGFVMVDKMTREMFPKAKIEYYNTNADMAYLVSTGKLDGFINDEPVIRYASLEVPELGYIHCDLETMNIVVAFQKNASGSALCEEFNHYIRKWKKDGSLQKTDDLWLSNDEEKKVVDFESLSNQKGKKVLRFATDASTPPFDYIKNGKIVGYEADLIARFCRQAGYALEVHNVPFDSLVMGLESGMYDLIAACLSETPAHKESLNLSESIYVSELVMAVQILDKKKGQKRLSPSDFNSPNVTLGVKTGTVMDIVTQEEFPLARVEHYNASPEMILRVLQGKIDGYLSDEPIVRYIESTTPGITHLKDIVRAQDYAFAFPKSPRGQQLRDQMNEFLKKIRENGILEKIDSVWFGSDKSLQKVDLDSFSGENGILTLVTDSSITPFTYIKDSEHAGYEIDIAARFCREYGYKLKIIDTRFSSIVPGLVSGKYDMAAALMGVTEERQKSIYFSDPDYKGGLVLAVKNHSQTASSVQNSSLSDPNKKDFTFGKEIASSFEKTFLRESRWKLVASGIGITVLISILSAIFGTVLGFAFCGLRLSKNKIADSLALLYIRLMQGLPMVVLLMILFYIVFAKTGLDGLWVAVIGFGMNFGAYVSEMIRTGILAVDKGQMEAALALGYTRRKAFLKMVLPQAARHFLPVFQGEFISLVKMTSVVGYIAIQDLTKASDIIRSRTYEAFFPLVTTAIIYFIIAWLLTRVLSALQTHLDPKKRRKVSVRGEGKNE